MREKLTDIVKRFCVANEKITAFFQMGIESIHKFFARFLIEINQHVSAENNVKLRLKIVCILNEIEMFESNHLSDFFCNLDFTNFWIPSTQQILML